MIQTPRRGFTLIELSIVLVIIGLIVGGILVGQNLIATAELRAGVSQLTAYSTAVNTFKLKYDDMPGDMPLQNANKFGLGGNFFGGNGDGVLQGYNGYPFFINTYPIAPLHNWATESPDYEIEWFFFQLALAKLVRGGPFADPTAYDGAPSNQLPLGPTFPFPKFAVGNSYVVPVTWDIDNGLWWYVGITQHANGAATPMGDLTNPFPLTPAQAYYIDQKLDDGVPSTGKVVALHYGAIQWTLDNIGGQCVTDGTGLFYNVTNTTMQCTLMIRSD